MNYSLATWFSVACVSVRPLLERVREGERTRVSTMHEPIDYLYLLASWHALFRGQTMTRLNTRRPILCENEPAEKQRDGI